MLRLTSPLGAGGVTAVVVVALLAASPAASRDDAGNHGDHGDHAGRHSSHRMPMVEPPPAAFEPGTPALEVSRSRTPAAGAGVHRLVLRLDGAPVVGSLRYLPPAGSRPVEQYAVAVRRGDHPWRTVTRGLWAGDPTAKAATWRAVRADRVRLTAYAEAADGPVALSADDVELRGAPYSDIVPPQPAVRRAAGSQGRWSDPIGLPLVPTTAVLLPRGKVLTMSAYSDTDYDFRTDLTQVSILDVGTRRAGQREVSKTEHQMFCTGVSVLRDGRVLITGGSSDNKTTLYDPRADEFTTGPEMQIPRGYQTSVTLSDGRVFVVGGSWSGGWGGKDGEVLDARATSWRRLPQVDARAILTDDEDGIFRADNHAWLFADRRGKVFHAGPSRRMNWFATKGDGRTTRAGRRGGAEDQMNGNAVMYARGRILAVGGAPFYDDAAATAKAWTIDIRRGPGRPVRVQRTGSLPEPRALHNSVVLPTGQVLVTGGQRVSLPFSDRDSVLAPSLWSPRGGRFRNLAPAAIPRNYHSWSLLLADGRVLAGGGGLCGDCEFNHPDAEIFTPPYLLEADGSRRSRPRIVSDVPKVLEHGQRLKVRTRGGVTSWALVRTGSATHSINSDQRRVAVRSDGGKRRHRLRIPSSGAAPPGSYLLFALDSRGTPSVARWLRIR